MKISWVEVFLALFCMVLLVMNTANILAIGALEGKNALLSEEVADMNASLGQAMESIKVQGKRSSAIESEMEKQYSGLALDISMLGMDLNITQGRVADIEGEFAAFREEYIELQQDYDAKVQDYLELMGQMEDFEEDLQEKMFWYTENADFGGARKPFLSEIKTECVEDESLNMPCVSFILGDKGFSYIGEGKDYIKSLEEFEDDGGGDCEDWSLFVKAVINHFREEEGIEEIRVVDFGSQGRFEVYSENNVIYYYPNDGVDIKVKDMEVACFPITAGRGHCAIAMGGVLFEPQDGSYLGEVHWEGNDYLIDQGGEIEVLISDEDIYVDSGEEWISYGYFIEKIDAILRGIEKEGK